jgi:hypothetical protein
MLHINCILVTTDLKHGKVTNPTSSVSRAMLRANKFSNAVTHGS